MDSSPPIKMDLVLDLWEKLIHLFADFPGSLNEDYIRRQLKRRNADISTVAKLDISGSCPLLRFLQGPHCSSEVLRLLFLNGIDVNVKDIKGRSVLVTAICYHARNASMIDVILKAGADVDILRFYKQCALCLAIYHGAPPEVIKMLLRAGSRPNCGEGFPPLHLATSYPDRKRRLEVLKVLIEGGAGLHSLSRDGRSVLCFALEHIASKQDIDLLIGLGIPTNACNAHGSPIICALDNIEGKAFTADIVDSLLSAYEAEDPLSGHDFLYTLPSALRFHPRFEVEGVQLDLSPLEPNLVEEYGTLLHAVTYNAYCTPDVVELLVKHGVPVDKVSSDGETVVHLALRNPVKHQLGILKVLLKHGCPVNAMDCNGRSTLALAVLLDKNPRVLKVLLDAGARVTLDNGSAGISVLETALDHHSDRTYAERIDGVLRWQWPNLPASKLSYIREKTKKKLLQMKRDCLDILLLYSFLENPELELKALIQGRKDAPRIERFARRCLHELGKLKQKEVGNGCTLYEFIRRPLNADRNTAENNIDFDQLLKILVDAQCNKYLDMIIDRVPRKFMESKLHELRVYTVREDPHLKIFTLNYQCVCEIAKYLSNHALMKLILAFHNCVKRTASGRVGD